MSRRTSLSIDWVLLSGLLTLSAISLFVLYSASDQNLDMLIRQSVRMGLALVVMLFIARIKPEQLMRWTPWIYGIGLLLLVIVLAVGVIGKGAKRVDVGALYDVDSYRPKLRNVEGMPMFLS